MPLYDWRCDEGHEFEDRAGFDEKTISCPVPVRTAGVTGRVSMAEIAARKLNLRPCGVPAHRLEIQQIAGVHFTGPGFTRTGA